MPVLILAKTGYNWLGGAR